MKGTALCRPQRPNKNTFSELTTGQLLSKVTGTRQAQCKQGRKFKSSETKLMKSTTVKMNQHKNNQILNCAHDQVIVLQY